MRILRVAQKLYPEMSGGGPYHVHALSRDQAARGHSVTVLTVSNNRNLPRYEKRDGYTVVRRSSTVDLFGNKISRAVARFLKEANEFDVIHAHSHLYFSTNLAAMKRRLSDTPLAITNHGLYSQSVPEWLFDMYLRTVGKWTFNRADVVFCYTQEERNAVQNLGISAPIEIIPNGIDQHRFTPEGPGSKRIDSDYPTVLFAGRLVEGKRPSTAIDAFVAIRDAFPNVKLYFVGKGPMENELREMAVKNGVSDAVTFLGHVDYGEMPRLYRSADLLFLPSRAEGLPRVVLESLSSETPVVTSALPQLESISTEGGRVAEVGDVSGFATALRELLADDSLRAELGERGRQLVEKKYTWEDLVSRTTDRLASLG